MLFTLLEMALTQLPGAQNTPLCWFHLTSVDSHLSGVLPSSHPPSLQPPAPHRPLPRPPTSHPPQPPREGGCCQAAPPPGETNRIPAHPTGRIGFGYDHCSLLPRVDLRENSRGSFLATTGRVARSAVAGCENRPAGGVSVEGRWRSRWANDRWQSGAGRSDMAGKCGGEGWGPGEVPLPRHHPPHSASVSAHPVSCHLSTGCPRSRPAPARALPPAPSTQRTQAPAGLCCRPEGDRWRKWDTGGASAAALPAAFPLLPPGISGTHHAGGAGHHGPIHASVRTS